MTQEYQRAADGSRLWIPGLIPGMNEILDMAKAPQFGKKRAPRGWNPYHETKRVWAWHIRLLARGQGFRVRGRHWWFLFHEPNRRRDPTNFICGGLKLIPDALQEAGLLANDGWRDMQSITTDYVVSKEPGVTVWTGEEPWKQ